MSYADLQAVNEQAVCQLRARFAATFRLVWRVGCQPMIASITKNPMT